MKTITSHTLLGVFAGLLGPCIGIYFFYMLNFSEFGLVTFLEESISNKLLSPLLSLSAIINLGIFYLLLHFDRLYEARGVILSTLICGLIIIMIKFVL